MAPTQEIGTLLIQTLGSMYLLIIMLRFMLQLAKADFYNPISQFSVKATSPLLLPLRRVIPGVWGIDLASLVLAVLIQYATIQLCLLILGHGFINPRSMLLWSVIGVLALTIKVYFWGLIIMIIASWVAPQSQNPALLLINQLVAPLMAPFKRFLPDMGGIDLSPIFVFLTLKIAEILIVNLAAASGMGGIAGLITGL